LLQTVLFQSLRVNVKIGPNFSNEIKMTVLDQARTMINFPELKVFSEASFLFFQVGLVLRKASVQ